MLHPAPRTVLFCLLVAASTLTACGRQQEGERCSLTNGNSDCDDDLVCTEAANLRNAEDQVDRCCPEAGEQPSDSRCELRATPGGGDGDLSGEGGAGGDTMSIDEPAGSGDACVYNSDCTLPLFCVQGRCRPQCNSSRDCPDGNVCNSDQLCVSE